MMKPRYRITVPGRRNELVDLIVGKMIDFEKSVTKFCYTYPHRSVAEKIAIAVIVAEKGEPHLLKPDAQRLTRMARVISNVHQQFDKDKSWNDGFCKHDEEATFLAEAISRSEITR